MVRPHPRRRGKYEILDGHNRAEILAELGAERVRCEIWPADDEQADVLSVALNQLRGRSDVRRRARCVRRVIRRLGLAEAAAALGLSPAALRQQTAPLRRPQADAGGKLLDLRPVVFHVPAADAAEVERALRRVGGRNVPRGEALVRALRAPARATRRRRRKAQRGTRKAERETRSAKRGARNAEAPEK
ncbi:MAG TPA: ParB N-terminal domain-containing protein [Phycisphaerae bacterium]|nr:ParB N-terminal domain-containing protein [Phycisphaerae bacterium]